MGSPETFIVSRAMKVIIAISALNVSTTVNSEVCENETLEKWRNHSVVY